MSKLWISTMVIACMTAWTVPEMRPTALNVVGCSSAVQLIRRFSQWFQLKYPEYQKLNGGLSAMQTFCQLGILRYVSQQLDILSRSHGSLIGLIHSIASTYYLLSSQVTYYGYFWGACGSLIILIVSPLMLNRLNQLQPLLTRIQESQNLDINFHGVNILSHSKNLVDEKTLDQIAPLRCPTLGNSYRQERTEYTTPDNCSICAETYSEKQLTRTLPCGHSFHAVCVDQWLLQRSAVCPICRRDVREHIRVDTVNRVNMVEVNRGDRVIG